MARSHVSAGRGRGAGVFARVSHRGRAARAEALERRTLLAAAPLDASFGRGGVERVDFGGAADFGWDAGDAASAAALLPDGKVLVVGTRQHGGPGGSADLHADSPPVLYLSTENDNVILARYNADGTRDRSFGTGGVVVTDLTDFDFGHGLAVLPGGDFVVGARTGDGYATVLRYAPDGTLRSQADRRKLVDPREVRAARRGTRTISETSRTFWAARATTS